MAFDISKYLKNQNKPVTQFRAPQSIASAIANNAAVKVNNDRVVNSTGFGKTNLVTPIKPLATYAQNLATGTVPTTTTTKTTTTTSGGSGSGSGGGAGAETHTVDYYAQLKAIYDQQLEAQRKARQDAYDASIKQQKSAYDASYGKVNDAADSAQRQAYVNYMQSQRTMPQAMTAQGLTGGASETNLASLLNTYGNARGQIDTERTAQLGELERTYNQNLAEAQNILNGGNADDFAAYTSNIANLIASNPTARVSLTQGSEAVSDYRTRVQRLMAMGYTAEQAAQIAAGSAGNISSLFI